MRKNGKNTNIPSVYHNTTKNMLKISLHICQHCGSQMEQEILAIALKVMIQMNLRNQNREKKKLYKKQK